MDEGRRSFAISARAGSAGGAFVRAQDHERSCDVLRPKRFDPALSSPAQQRDDGNGRQGDRKQHGKHPRITMGKGWCSYRRS